MDRNKCPNCRTVIQEARCERLYTDERRVIIACTVACPSCYTILGVVSDIDSSLRAIISSLGKAAIEGGTIIPIDDDG